MQHPVKDLCFLDTAAAVGPGAGKTGQVPSGLLCQSAATVLEGSGPVS